MKAVLAAIAFSVIGAATCATATPMPTTVLRDLDDGQHVIPREWSTGGVLILGFEHNSRDAMDQWVTALGLGDNAAWFEAPVVGAVPDMVRPIIRSGMRSRYAGARRSHVAPIFEHADEITRLVDGHGAIAVVDASGQVIARADGAPSEASLRTIRDALARDQNDR